VNAVFEDLGRIGYKDAWDLQLRLHAERVADARPDTVLFCEHDPVLTMGKSGKGQNLLVSQDELRRRGVEYYAIERGGDLTYHGPGQLVVYPIFKLPRLREVQAFVRKMERSIIRALETFGIAGEQRADHAGVFARDAKICSIGAAVRSGVTYHGLALEVCTDLSYFQLINPCGMPDVPVTSISRELGREVRVQEAKSPVRTAMIEIYGLEPIAATSPTAETSPIVEMQSRALERGSTVDIR
jgi:lipoyl(octanoyl) transferase